MTERCTVIRLRLADLERSAEDPKLAALLREGWTVEADLALSEEDGPPTWVLLLAPPGEVVEDRLARFQGAREVLAFALAALLIGGALGFAFSG